MFSWNTRDFLKDHYFLFLGIAYLFIGSMDLIHTLAYSGMNILPGIAPDAATQLWIANRYLESFSLLLSFLFLTRKVKEQAVLLIYLGICILILTAIFGTRIFPTCFIEGAGLTLFKKGSEYFISLLLVASFLLLLKKRAFFDIAVLQWMQAAIFFTILSELAFTFYINAYGISNRVGHLLKIISFYCVYKAVIEIGLRKPCRLLFRELNEYKKKLERKVQERTTKLLQKTNNLQHEITERNQAEASLQWELSVNKTLAQMTNAIIMPSFSVEEVACMLLKASQGLIGNANGYISPTDPVNGTPSVHTTTMIPAVECTTTQDNTVVAAKVQNDRPFVTPLSTHTSTEAVYTNSPVSHVRYIGLPQDNLELNNYLFVPIITQGKVAGQLALTNSPTGFTPRHLAAIEQLAAILAIALQRKEADNLQITTSERLNLASKSAGIGIWDWSVQRDVLLWDNRMYDIYGVRKEDNYDTQKIIIKGMHPDDATKSKEKIQAALKDNQEFHDEFRIIQPDGSIHYIESHADVYRDEHGNPIRMIGVSRVITDRKLAEQELDKYQLQLEELVEKRTIRLRDEINVRQKAEQELRQYTSDLERFNRFAVDRESKMIELKKEANNLLKQLELKAKYKLNNQDTSQ